MTTPTEPAKPESLKEAAHRIAEESAARQGLPLEVTEAAVLHQVAQLILSTTDD